MTPYYKDDWLTVFHGDCRAVMAEMEPESVHCVITSPPYWGLRDYGTATWVGGDAGCDHLMPIDATPGGRVSDLGRDRAASGGTFHGGPAGQKRRQFDRVCGRCGATRIDAQLGLEPTPEEYVANLVAVFREVRRVLRADGTVWLNLGDSYANTGKSGGGDQGKRWEENGGAVTNGRDGEWKNFRPAPPGLKPKDLVGIPWRVAFALQQPYYTGTIPDERDRIWLAAMIDGEGCLFLHKRGEGLSNGQGYVRKNATYGAGLEVSNTSEAIVNRVMAITGRGSISRVVKGRNQPLFRWNLRSNECRDVIREVYPHLVAKQHQARLLLGCPSSGPNAEAAWTGLQSLHHGTGAAIDFPAPESMFEPGWYLRSDIVWAKSNPMPESVTDRPTKSHEYIFLLAKSARYYFDADAVREDGEGRLDRSPQSKGRLGSGGKQYVEGAPHLLEAAGRNIRSVWTVATAPYPGAHFATFPPKLIEPCIKAGTSERGVCPECGAPWEREVERATPPSVAPSEVDRFGTGEAGVHRKVGGQYQKWLDANPSQTTDWRSACAHDAAPIPATILDPFAGSGTTGMVAQSLSRRAVLIDLSLDYLGQLMGRNADIPLGLGA